MKQKKPRTIEEDLASINEEDLLRDEKKSLSPRTKRIIILSVALFLVVLMSSWVYIQYPLFGIIAGQIESRGLNGNVLVLNEFSVVFREVALEKVRESYALHPDVETSLCLLGEKINGDYMIRDAYKPFIYEQSYRHVSHEACSEETIIMFHTHPYKSCIASETDIDTLRRNQARNPDMLTLIMCEPNRYSIYT